MSVEIRRLVVGFVRARWPNSLMDDYVDDRFIDIPVSDGYVVVFLDNLGVRLCGTDLQVDYVDPLLFEELELWVNERLDSSLVV